MGEDWIKLLPDGRLDDSDTNSEYERGFVDCWNKYVKAAHDEIERLRCPEPPKPRNEDHADRLRVIASVLRSGAAGQRDEWVDQLAAAATEIERLKRQYDACRRLLDQHGILEDTRDAAAAASV